MLCAFLFAQEGDAPSVEPADQDRRGDAGLGRAQAAVGPTGAFDRPLAVHGDDELTVSPTGSPARPRVVRMVTPVAKVPSAARKSRVSKAAAASGSPGDGSGMAGSLGCDIGRL